MDVNRYDLLIKNGIVYDPVKNLNVKADVGVVEPNIAEIFNPSDMTARICSDNIIDAEGYYVVPGLIDFHSHFLPGLSFGSTTKQLYKQGVTATSDMGSCTHIDFNVYRKQYMDNELMPTNATINLSSLGFNMEEHLFCSPVLIEDEKVMRVLEINKDVLLGVKFPVSTPIVDEKTIHDVFQRARRILDATDMKMSVHITNPPIPFTEFIEYFKEGDIVTHTFHGVGHTILDENGKVWPEAWEAKKRGVVFEVARGARHWSFDTAAKAFEQGFFPDILSSDFTALSSKPLTGQLPTVMSEVMSLGMSFEDVIKKVTYAPAENLKGIKTGLERGLPANITVLDIEEGEFTFADSAGNKRVGNKLIVPKATVIKGQVVYNTIG